MATKNQKPAPVVEEVETLEIEGGEELDLGDLEIEGVEEVDVVEAELEEAAAPTATQKAVPTEKTKKTAPSGSTLSSVQPLGENEVGAAYIAELCGVDAREIRGFMRANYRNMDTTKGQRYRFQKGDPIIQEIADAFKTHKAGVTEEQKERGKALAAQTAAKKAEATKPVATTAVKPTAQAVKPAAVAQKPAVQTTTKPTTVATKPAATPAPAKRTI